MGSAILGQHFFEFPSNQNLYSIPPPSQGVWWRALQKSDARVLFNLIECIEQHDRFPFRTSLDEIIEMLENPHGWWGIIAYEDEAHVSGAGAPGLEARPPIAYGLVSPKPGTNTEYVCQGGVRPYWRGRGLGRATATWQTRQARQVIGEKGDGGTITFGVQAADKALTDQLERLGYTWARTYYELRASLNFEFPVPPLDYHVHIEPWSEQYDDMVRRTFNRLAAQEWARLPRTPEEWAQGRSYFKPEWSFIVVDKRGDRPQIAGYLMASAYEQDWDALGWEEGYIDHLGVVDAYHSLPVAEALIATSMRAQKNSGMSYTATSVGSRNHTRAARLYTDSGFTVMGESLVYLMEIPPENGRINDTIGN